MAEKWSMLGNNSAGSRCNKFFSHQNLYYEKERLKTFCTNWFQLKKNWLNPCDLAREGFYYLKSGDFCGCQFCKGVIGQWIPGDTPRGEHSRHFPSCPIVRGVSTANVPLSHSIILDGLSLDKEDFARPGEREEFNSSNCPKHSIYVQLSRRIKSFTPRPKWPEYRFIMKEKERLAEAGFYYTGLSDHVRCFHCGGGLRNWAKDDDPWVQHAIWFPRCRFLINVKGQPFIDIMNISVKKYDFSPIPNNGDDTERRVIFREILRPSSGQFKPLLDDDLDVLMTAGLIEKAISSGMPERVTRKTLRRKIETDGLPFFSYCTLTEAILSMMEEESTVTIGDIWANSLTSRSETQKVKSSASVSNGLKKYTCSICTTNYRDVVLVPCHHVVCWYCIKRIKCCPFCRSFIKSTINPIYCSPCFIHQLLLKYNNGLLLDNRYL